MQKIIFLSIITLAMTSRSFAQIEGSVTDTSGKAIANAIIIAIDSARNTTDTINSDKGGYFVYKNLKRGEYKITAKASGYQKAVYDNIVVRNETAAGNKSSDISGAEWVEIVMKPIQPGKK